MTFKECIDEYARVMNSIDITPEFRARLTERYTAPRSHALFPVKTAVAATAVTGTAIAVAFGIRRHMRKKA
ncbi:MAG: hypothetical protein IK085_02830 [Clostridia bacterium]|nr:hypothetical protein [Clostridia bacterium]MBR6004890.1 hypothetical protein [Clostridia bacterium]